MASSSSAKLEGFWRALQLLLGPFAFAAKVAAAVILILAAIAAGLIWALDAMIPRARQRPQPPAEVQKLVTRLASNSPFQDLTAQQCRRARRAMVGSPPTDSCTYAVGKTSARISWNTENGRVWSVALTRSIPDNERAAHQSAPLGWLDFPEVHRIFCAQNSDTTVVMTSLPQRLALMPWVRWAEGKSVPAGPNELNAGRSVDVAKNDGCDARLTETRGKDQLQVTLHYAVLGRSLGLAQP
jgi:hypothetical protein